MPSSTQRRDFLALVALGAYAAPWWTQADAAPALALAQVYRADVALADYWVSEKYDGVRAYWDGRTLRSRSGEALSAPAWFTVGWPADTPLDGELWAGRGRFSHAQSATSSHPPDDAAWQQLRFMVFDLPAHPGIFDERLPALQATVAKLGQAWVLAVPQQRVSSDAALQELLERTTRAGGEGLMLRLGSTAYRGGRSSDLLKVKTHEDAEAKVVAHLPGQGKYAGRLGALLVEMPSGQRFRLGTGLSDAQRSHPPAIGNWVTYRFRGQHDSGLPRFASFVRVSEALKQ